MNTTLAAKLLYSSAVTDSTIISNYQTLDSFCSKLAKKQSWVFSTFSVKLKVDETEKFDRMGQWWMLTDLQRQSKNMYLKDIIQHYLKITGFSKVWWSWPRTSRDIISYYPTTALPRPRIKYAWAQIVWRWRLVQRGDDQMTTSAWKSSIQRFVITEKAPTRAFSWLKVATTAFTFKTLLRHYAKQVLTPWDADAKVIRDGQFG